MTAPLNEPDAEDVLEEVVVTGETELLLETRGSCRKNIPPRAASELLERRPSSLKAPGVWGMVKFLWKIIVLVPVTNFTHI